MSIFPLVNRGCLASRVVDARFWAFSKNSTGSLECFGSLETMRPLGRGISEPEPYVCHSSSSLRQDHTTGRTRRGDQKQGPPKHIQQSAVESSTHVLFCFLVALTAARCKASVPFSRLVRRPSIREPTKHHPHYLTSAVMHRPPLGPGPLYVPQNPYLTPARASVNARYCILFLTSGRSLGLPLDTRANPAGCST